jgi:hypothetical protein
VEVEDQMLQLDLQRASLGEQRPEQRELTRVLLGKQPLRRKERGDLVAAAQALNVFAANLSIQHLPASSPTPDSLAHGAATRTMQPGTRVARLATPWLATRSLAVARNAEIQ